jgi:hypothetical protein
MDLHSMRFRLVFAGFMALAMPIGLQSALAQDVAHAISGVVKSVDKETKTFVVKADDGTEHTIKWTEKTTVKTTEDTGKGVAAGSEDAAKDAEKVSVDSYLGAKQGTRVTVKYTEKAGEKTATGVKDASKATAKAVAE